MVRQSSADHGEAQTSTSPSMVVRNVIKRGDLSWILQADSDEPGRKAEQKAVQAGETAGVKAQRSERAWGLREPARHLLCMAGLRGVSREFQWGWLTKGLYANGLPRTSRSP